MGFEHFSHIHELIPHQEPQDAQITCTGCNSPGTGSVYVCWQCGFFLHELCFRASCSMKHPSHPAHPLILVLYPTYSSKSFSCNTCNLGGTGFCYSCAECEFDLHVRCAYKSDTTIPESQPFVLPQYHSIFSETPTTQTSHRNVLHQDLSFIDNFFNNPRSPPANYMPQTAVNEPFPNQTWPSLITPVTIGSTWTPLPPQTVQRESGVSFKEAQIKKHETKPQSSYQNISNQPEKLKEDPKVASDNYEWNANNLKREIEHKSHPEHPLKLLQSPPYQNGEFKCDACSKNGTAASLYHCSTCQFDLHINCATLPEPTKREDHKNPLNLLYLSPLKNGGEGQMFACDVCRRTIPGNCWLYHRKECDYGNHVGCAEAKAMSELEAILAAQVQMQRINVQTRIASRSLQSIANVAQMAADGSLYGDYKWTYTPTYSNFF